MEIRKRDYEFFRDNAGGIVGQRALGAIHMARAEKLAEFHGYTFEWDWDDTADLGEHEYWCRAAQLNERGRHSDGSRCDHIRPHGPNKFECNHETLYAVMKSPDGDIVQSLGGIIDPSNAYRRVIEAELALEHFGAVDSLAAAS